MKEFLFGWSFNAQTHGHWVTKLAPNHFGRIRINANPVKPKSYFLPQIDLLHLIKACLFVCTPSLHTERPFLQSPSPTPTPVSSRAMCKYMIIYSTWSIWICMHHLIRACFNTLLLRSKVVLVPPTRRPCNHPPLRFHPIVQSHHWRQEDQDKSHRSSPFQADLHEPRSSGRRHTLSFDFCTNWSFPQRERHFAWSMF